MYRTSLWMPSIVIELFISISEIFELLIGSVREIIEPWVKDILNRQLFVEYIVYKAFTE